MTSGQCFRDFLIEMLPALVMLTNDIEDENMQSVVTLAAMNKAAAASPELKHALKAAVPNPLTPPSPSTLIDALIRDFEREDAVLADAALTELRNLRLGPGSCPTLMEYVRAHRRIANKMRAVGGTTDPTVLRWALLEGLPSSLRTAVVLHAPTNNYDDVLHAVEKLRLASGMAGGEKRGSDVAAGAFTKSRPDRFPADKLPLKSGDGVSCTNCGFVHEQQGRCPAAHERCRTCKAVGHFSRCCPSSATKAEAKSAQTLAFEWCA